MAYPTETYSDDERERLRKALADYADTLRLKPQGVALKIMSETGYALDGDAGRKRVARFLDGEHRQTDDFIGAVARYLRSVPPPKIEESAATLADFFARPYLRKIDLAPFIGRYRAYVSRDRRAATDEGDAQVTTLSDWEFKPQPVVPLADKIAYGVVRLRPFEKYNALFVSEAITNLTIDPAVTEFPDNLPQTVDAGVMVPFGFSERAVPRFLMATRSVLESRLYRLYQVDDDPLTLRGELNFNGGIGRIYTRDTADPLFPDYEIELVRMKDQDE